MDIMAEIWLSISKSKYNDLFHNIENKTVSVNVAVNKRGRTLYQANKMVLTCTVRDIEKSCLIRDIQFLLVKLLA